MSLITSNKHKTEKDIYLMAGDVYFGRDAQVVRTLLGSCAAAIIWHPKLKFTGMFHIVLPEAPRVYEPDKELRYADKAVDFLNKRVIAAGTNPQEYRVYVCGGGDMFNMGEEPQNIGIRNTSAVIQYMRDHHFVINQENIGGNYYRHIRIWPETGETQCEKHQVIEPHLPQR